MTETHGRTVAKAITYRIMAVVSSVVMVGWYSAIFVELSKTLVYYVCERAWLRTQWGTHNHCETMTRSIAKAVVYRAVATVAVAYWVGWYTALWLALVQTLIFVANDRAWQYIQWGRFDIDHAVR